MSSITVRDLAHSVALDRKAMTAIRGGDGAAWVFGWIQPYVPSSSGFGPVVNLYQTNNTFYAGQMINQFQAVDVNNTGANSNINVTPNAVSKNRAG
ncbi:hypothetical protein [Paraburkholderia sp.]|jgi:hypothetical protein|uniref:hypothetical protein n=1 Tax=Paraburkholderia sp. TaxID=1926495 RepID=UPI002F40A713